MWDNKDIYPWNIFPWNQYPSLRSSYYKAFARPHHDYGNILYDQPNDSFSQKIESIQYNAAIAVTGTITKTSQLKLYGYLAFTCLKFRRWFRWLVTFY